MRLNAQSWEVEGLSFDQEFALIYSGFQGWRGCVQDKQVLSTPVLEPGTVFVFVFVFVFVCVLAEPRECSFTERKDCPTRARWRNSGARGKWGSCVRANLATSLCLNSHFYQKAGTTLVKRSTVTQLGTGVASHDRLLTQHSSAARTLPKKNTKHKCATSAPTYPGAALTSRRCRLPRSEGLARRTPLPSIPRGHRCGPPRPALGTTGRGLSRLKLDLRVVQLGRHVPADRHPCAAPSSGTYTSTNVR